MWVMGEEQHLRGFRDLGRHPESGFRPLAVKVYEKIVGQEW